MAVQLKGVSKNKAAALGLIGEEHEQVYDLLDREPNEFEARFYVDIWNESYSLKSTNSLISRIPRTSSSSTSEVGSLTLENVEGDLFELSNLVSNLGLKLAARGNTPIASFASIRVGSYESSAQTNRLNRISRVLRELAQKYNLGMIEISPVFDPNFDRISVVDLSLLGIPVSATNYSYGVGDHILYLGAETGSSDLSSFEIYRRLVGLLPEISGLEVMPIGSGNLNTVLFELFNKLSDGFSINLDKVPVSAEKMKASDVLTLKGPERVLFLASKKTYEEVYDSFSKWGFRPTIVGEIEDTGFLTCEWRHQRILELPVKLSLETNIQKEYKLIKYPPSLKKPSMIRNVDFEQDAEEDGDDVYFDEYEFVEDHAVDLLGSSRLCSKDILRSKSLENTAGAFLGYNYLPCIYSTLDKAVRGVSLRQSREVLSIDPYLGAAVDVSNLIGEIVAAGLKPESLFVQLCSRSPEYYRDLSLLAEITRALADSAKYWDVSASQVTLQVINRAEVGRFMQSYTIGALGTASSFELLVPGVFLSEGTKLRLIGEVPEQRCFSEYATYCRGVRLEKLAEIVFSREKELYRFLDSATDVMSFAKRVEAGGVVSTLAQAGVPNQMGVKLSIDYPGLRQDECLFSECSGRYVVGASEEKVAELDSMLSEAGVSVYGEGEVTGKSIKVNKVEMPLKTATRVWRESLKASLIAS